MTSKSFDGSVESHRERLGAGLACAALTGALSPPWGEVFPQAMIATLVVLLLLEAQSQAARLHRLGSGTPALLLALGLPPLGSPWTVALALVVSVCLNTLVWREKRQAAALGGACAVLVSSLLQSVFPLPGLWLPLFLLVSVFVVPGGNELRRRCSLSIGEMLWTGALLWSCLLGIWPYLGCLLAFLAYHGWREQSEEGNRMIAAFVRQMDQAEDTVRAQRQRQDQQREKFQGFVALQTVLDDFQGQALRVNSKEALAEALLRSARGLDAGADGAVVVGKERRTAAVLGEFRLESFGPLPSLLSEGKVLQSPDGMRVVFPLSHDCLFLWRRPTPEREQLRDEMLRHLLERASLIWCILGQQQELSGLLLEKTQALEELASSQAQLVQSGKMAAVGQMAAGVAHELNSPLAAILLQSQMGTRRLRKNDLEGVLVSLQTCESASERARTIIKNLLAFSRLTDGRRAVTPLAPLLKQSLAMLAGHFEQAEVSCMLELDESLQVEVNPQDLQHVLTNIAVNAVDALKTRSDERRLQIRTALSGDKIDIELANNGPSIPESALEKVFEPFFTTKEAGQGTGLGLSLAYQLVEAHNGVLTVENRKDWVVFRIVFPTASKELK